MRKTHTFFFLCLFLSGTKVCSAQTVTDIDGNTYPVLTIGQQQWMGANLKTTHFNNGDPIPTIVEAVSNDPSAVYQWSYDNDTTYVQDYGRLYSWYAATDSRNVCPTGWKVPSLSDWEVLAQQLGGDSIAGFSLKETDTFHWNTTTAEVTNSSGFTALPGGFRGNSYVYLNLGMFAHFWSTDQVGFDLIFKRGHMIKLSAANGVVDYGVGLGSCGSSLRCLYDESLGEQPTFIQENELFPNPANQTVTVRFSDKVSGTLYLTAADGKVLEEHPFHQNLVLNVSHLTAGTYFLKVANAGGWHEQRLIIR